MALEALRANLPAYARDLALNLEALAQEPVLTEQQKWGCFIAAAQATGGRDLIRAVERQAQAEGLSADVRCAAKSAAAIMAMNNIYYRATHLLPGGTYRTLPSRLRMNVIANPGVDKRDFELWSLAVSAVNGCGVCLEAHEVELRRGCVTAPVIQAALRIAAVVVAVGQVLVAEEALSAASAI